MLLQHCYAAIAVCLLLISCSSQEENKPTADIQPPIQSDSAAVNPYLLPPPLVRYSKKVTANAAELATIRRLYGNSQETRDAYRALTTINRKELRFFRVGDTVVYPDSISSDLRLYSALPQYYPGAKTLKKLIVVSNEMQCYGCYEYGHLVRFCAANTGERRKPTFPGRYALTWRQRLRRSSLDSTWMLPFTWNFHPYAGSAFHQFEMPGRPVSHSCVRQFIEDAEWLYRWGNGGKRDSLKRWVLHSGTPVIILGMFNYSRKHGGPWRDIATNREGIVELPANPMDVEEALIPISQIPQEVRGMLPNRSAYMTADSVLKARGVISENTALRESINYNKLRKIKAAQKKLLQKNKSQEAENIQKSDNIDKAPGSE